MIRHDPGCSGHHSVGQKCDGHDVFIDKGRVGSCLIALPIVLPFLVFAVAFSGDAGGITPSLILFMFVLTVGFLVAAYALLTVIDWIGKHI